jgi:hypothetical protein
MQTRAGLLLWFLFFCAPVSADDWLRCPAGKYGDGGEYKVPMRCFEGKVLAQDEEYCPSTRGKYQPKYRKCIDGVDTLVGLSEEVCMKKGGGYQLYGPQHSCCIDGHVVGNSSGRCSALSKKMEGGGNNASQSKHVKSVPKKEVGPAKRDRSPMVWLE